MALPFDLLKFWQTHPLLYGIQMHAIIIKRKKEDKIPIYYTIERKKLLVSDGIVRNVKKAFINSAQ